MSIVNKSMILGAFLVAGSVLASAGGASAFDRRVTIINNTDYDIVSFYASNVATNSWQEDILGDDQLGARHKVVVNIDDGTGYCKFDFRAVFNDGTDLVRHGVNVCEVSTFTYH